ncbi:hypothetical protein B0H19DRAFT_1079898 [Mycena capillaripes]|nr:hypothetical protein B0H19DRAFT_1079898 [Mycena capillaripes]
MGYSLVPSRTGVPAGRLAQRQDRKQMRTKHNRAVLRILTIIINRGKWQEMYKKKNNKRELPNGSVPSRTGVSAVRLESLDVIADAHQARPSPPLLLQFLNALGFAAHKMYEMWLTGYLPSTATLIRVPELCLEDDNLNLRAGRPRILIERRARRAVQRLS